MLNAERSLSVTSNNIINADTPGYSRRRVENAPVGMQLGSHQVGLGVNITSIKRLRNELTDMQMTQKRQEMGYMYEKMKTFEQLETSMASDSGGDLDMRISRLFDSFSELSNDPQDLSVRNHLLGEASQLIDKLGDISRNLDRTSEISRQNATGTIAQINDLLEDLASLNKAITVSGATGRPDHDSLDLQVQKLEKLSELVDIETMTAENGSLEVRIGGVQILSEDRARIILPDINDIDKKFGLHLENGTNIPASGGKLAASIEMYEERIPDFKNRLDLIAETLVTEINTLHRQGFGLEDDQSRNFFDPNVTSAGTIRIDEAIANNSQHIAASSMDGEAGNGEIAMAIAQLRSEQIIEGRKLLDYSVDLISNPGSNLARLRTAVETHKSEIRMLEVQQEQEAGVNIDEELSLMIRYQNAYQSAARVISSAQQMYDTLISLVR